jgi:steroid delta-isomerase-like uncharacterized protein
LTEGDNEKIVRAFIEAVGKMDFDSAEELVSSDFKLVGVSTVEYDFEGACKQWTKEFSAISDPKYDFIRTVTQDNTVVIEYIWSMTHVRDLFGIKATNRRIKLPIVDIFELENGKIRLEKHYANALLFQQQLTDQAYTLR